MRILLQRVKSADVKVKGTVVACIEKGLLLLVGIGRDDGPGDLEYMAKKIVNLRIFEDEHGKMNLDISQVKGQILSVPQFTLFADTQKGNRPGFARSAGPETAKEYWNDFNNLLRTITVEVKEGVFGADMEVGLINDGPVTIWLDTKDR